MAADAYLRAAAGDLEKAAQEVKSQMDKARSDYKLFESEATHFIDNLEGDIRANTIQMSLNNTDPGVVSHLTAEISRMKKAIEDKKKEIKQRRAELDSRVATKEGTRNDLISNAHSLANKSGNPALR